LPRIESEQLEARNSRKKKKKKKSREAARSLSYSLYPRVTPPRHRIEEGGEVLIPRAVRHPTALVGFDEEVALGPAAAGGLSNLADVLRDHLGADVPHQFSGAAADDDDARSRKLRQAIAGMEDDGARRFPVLLGRLRDSGYDSLLGGWWALVFGWFGF
jgi:hypothetical protein